MVPLGRLVVVMFNAPLIVMLSACVLVCGGVLESVAETVNFAVPAVVGVPLMAPALLMVKPAGKLPVVTAQVTVPVPPAL